MCISGNGHSVGTYHLQMQSKTITGFFQERELAVRSLQATLGFDFKLREEFIRKFLLR